MRRPYAGLALGNSRILLGLNPEKISFPTYNFAFQADAYDIAYYKLLFLEAHGNLPRVLILGVDDYQFSYLDQARRAYYAPYFPPEFAKDSPRAGGTRPARMLEAFFHPSINDAFNAYMTLNFSQTLDWSLKYAAAVLHGEPVQPRYVLKETANISSIAWKRRRTIIRTGPSTGCRFRSAILIKCWSLPAVTRSRFFSSCLLLKTRPELLQRCGVKGVRPVYSE